MDKIGYGVPFVLGSLAGMAAAAIFSRMKTASFTARRTSMRQVVGILKRDRGFTVYSLALMFMGTGLLVGLPIYPVVQVDQLHLTYGDVGVLSLITALVWMLSSTVLGGILDRKGALPIMLLANVAQAIMPLLYISGNLFLIAVAFASAGLANAGGDLGWPNVIMLFATPERLPDYTALHMLLVGMRGIIGPLLGATLLGLAGLSLHQTLLVAFAMQACGCLIMVWVTFTYRSPRLGVSTSSV
jgi:hypothetical protein